MGQRNFVKSRNFNSPYGKKSIFHNYYDDPWDSIYGEEIDEDQFAYEIIPCESGTEVFELYEKKKNEIIEPIMIHIFVEKTDEKKSNFFGTACRVVMGSERLALMQNHLNESISISVHDDLQLAKNLHQWAEDIAYHNRDTDKKIDATTLENAVRLELLDQNEVNQMLKTIFGLNNKLANWMNSGVERMEEFKFTAENYDYENCYIKPMYNKTHERIHSAHGFTDRNKTVTYKPIIPVKHSNDIYKRMADSENGFMGNAGIKKLLTLHDKLDEIAMSIVYNVVKATPTIADDIFFAVIFYIKNYLEEHLLGEFKEIFKKVREIIKQSIDFLTSVAGIIEKFTYDKIAELNALLCGIINGLISLMQTVIAVLALIVGNIPFLEMEKANLTEIAKHQEKLEFIEDLVDMVKDNLGGLFTGLISFFTDTNLWKEFSDFIGELYKKAKGLNRYFWAFFIGGVLFEIILDVIIAYFTGGVSTVAEITSKITRLATKAEELAAKGIKIRRNAAKKVAETASGLYKWIKKEFEELIKAFSEGKILSYLKKKISQLFGIKYLDKIENLDQLLDFIDAVDEQYTAKDLDKVGIGVLFRGTTKNADGSVFSGNLNTIANGISTSTDPVVATIFALESETKTGKQGVVQIILPKKINGVSLLPSNERRFLELEVVLKMSAEDFTKSKGIIEISTNEARKLMKELYDIDLPTRISSQAYSDELLRDIQRLNLKESFKLLKKIKK